MMGKEYIITTCAVWHTFEHGRKPKVTSRHSDLREHERGRRLDQVYYTDQARNDFRKPYNCPRIFQHGHVTCHAHLLAHNNMAVGASSLVGSVTSPAALWIQPRAMETAYCDPDGVET